MGMGGSDQELVGQMLDGGDEAFAELYRRHQGPVFRFALHMTGGLPVAEDVTQEVFLALMEHARRFDALRGTLRSFLFGIARNHVMRRLEQERGAHQEPAGLDVLPAGPATRRASDLIGAGLAELIEEASRDYDLIVLDAPPLLGFAEPLQMATAVDGVIVVARTGNTSRAALSSVITTLTRLRANLVGVVLNEVHREVSSRYYYSYYNRHGKYYAQQGNEGRAT